MHEFLIRLACFLAGAGVGILGLTFWACLKIAKEEDRKIGADEMNERTNCNE